MKLKNAIKKVPKVSGVYSINNLTEIKDWAYVINFDEHELLGNNWITLYMNRGNATYFDSFGDEYISEEI